MKENKNRKRNNKSKNQVKDERAQATVIVILVFLLVILVIGVTYAVFQYASEGKKINQVTTGTITINYTEGKTGISINNAMPVSEEVGKALSNANDLYDFTVSTEITGDQGIIYEVVAAKDNNSTIANNEVRLYLQSGTTAGVYGQEELVPTAYTPINQDDKIGAKAGEMILATKGIYGTTSEITYYRLIMWVDSSYQLSNTAKSFTVRVNVYAKDATLNEINSLQ